METYTLHGSIVLDRTPLRLDGIEVTSAVLSPDGTMSVNVSGSRSLIDAQLTVYGEPTSSHLQEFLWGELDGRITFEQSDCSFDWTIDGAVITIQEAE